MPTNIKVNVAPGLYEANIVRLLAESDYNCTAEQSRELARLVDCELCGKIKPTRFFGLTDKGLLKVLRKHFTPDKKS